MLNSIIKTTKYWRKIFDHAGNLLIHFQSYHNRRKRVGNIITLIESRPRWDDDSQWIDMKIARMKFNNDSMKWKLYWCNQHQKFFSYDGLSPKTEIKELLKEIDEDPTCIFWG